VKLYAFPLAIEVFSQRGLNFRRGWGGAYEFCYKSRANESISIPRNCKRDGRLDSRTARLMPSLPSRRKRRPDLVPLFDNLGTHQ
jgi:hypothetical protein